MMRAVTKIIIVIIVVLVAARIALPFILLKKANEKLNTIPDFYGSVDSVDVGVLRGKVVFHNIQVTTADKNMALTVKDFGVNWEWLPLLHRTVVASALVQSPRLRLLTPMPSETGAVVQKEAAVAAKEAPPSAKKKPPESLPDELSSMIPFVVNRFAIRDGTIRIRDVFGNFNRQADKDKAQPPYAEQSDENSRELLIHKIDLDVDNITNTAHETGSKWAHARAKALIMNSGRVDLTMNFNPTAKEPLFDLNFQEKGLDLTELNPVFIWQTGMDVKHGGFELFAEAAAADGKFQGYVKPFIEDLKMLDISQDKKKGVGHVIKQAVVGAVVAVFKNHKENELSTKIPFSGSFSSPSPGIWQAVAEVLHNMLIRALPAQLDHSISVKTVVKDEVRH